MGGTPPSAGRSRTIGTLMPCPPGPQNCPPDNQPKKDFILGINFPWFEGQYDHDFGDNYVMTDIRDQHYRQNGLTPPASPVSAFYNPAAHDDKIKGYFDTMSKMGFSVVRIWAFERFEGLMFEYPNRPNQVYSVGSVYGVDSKLINNFSRICGFAKDKGLKVYIGLLDTWALWKDVTINGTGISTQLKRKLVDTLGGLITDTAKCDSFINNAVVPLLSAVPADSVFAVDVLNEPEGILVDERNSWNDRQRAGYNGPRTAWNFGDIDWKCGHVHSFVKRCADKIRGNSALAGRGIKVSCGLQLKNSIQQFSGNSQFSSALDFYDYHRYHDNGTLDRWTATDKPCIIGECNYEHYSGTATGEADEAKAIGLFLDNAARGGYAGCCVWSFETAYTPGNPEKEKSVVKPNGAPKQPVCAKINCFNRNRVNRKNTI